MNNIRNFSIIAHIDHGKSTLADRLLEITGTIEKRKMKEQVLDQMDLERERGITIKMQPVRMHWKLSATSYQLKASDSDTYVLNLIDTPGHIDFSYEVSRALKAVEGCLLLVDSTQGVQAQTLTTLSMAKEQGLAIIPVLSKIDSPLSRKEDVKSEIVEVLGCSFDDIIETSGKTGEGVEELLREIVKRIPPPKSSLKENDLSQALIFDFEYSNHQGVILYVRMFEGRFKKGDNLFLHSSEVSFRANDVGFFIPAPVSSDFLNTGEIGYVVTGIKEPGIARIGDTVTFLKNKAPALTGFEKPKPVVWASIYPESQDDFNVLRQALFRLKLSDSSISFEEEHSGVLGRGFRVGFLGMLHLEIITERLRREFGLKLIVTTPSIVYEVALKNGKKEVVYTPALFPDHGQILSVKEPWVDVVIITPPEFLSGILQLMYNHEALVGETKTFADNRNELQVSMPLRELMRNFFDEIKSVSSGFASLSYEISDMKEADVTKLEILVAEKEVAAFARVVSKAKVAEEAERAVEKLYEILPRQLFVTKIQGQALGRIISSRTLSALRKDVLVRGGKTMGGGDVTRKKKLLEKQKEGKKKLKERGSVNIPEEVFIKMLKE